MRGGLWAILVPQIVKEIGEVWQNVSQEQIVGLEKMIPQEPILVRFVEQLVRIPAPQIVEEIAETIRLVSCTHPRTEC